MSASLNANIWWGTNFSNNICWDRDLSEKTDFSEKTSLKKSIPKTLFFRARKTLVFLVVKGRDEMGCKDRMASLVT
jgi:hypothetical protein